MEEMIPCEIETYSLGVAVETHTREQHTLSCGENLPKFSTQRQPQITVLGIEPGLLLVSFAGIYSLQQTRL